ncbi:unnamed protein product [Caenorhabditis angaria]|uniref:Uncharacterized protein n=1 Tax=Caenorhabditis angaria TaxID=860376 RepID=A0A9P1IC12_9PELO|nr:unnamed protein product [Caenorhabditis angaria]
MTATTSSNSSRFTSEKRPPVMATRRDERFKNFHSFDEITESEEEDVQEPTSSNSSTTSERSPYAVYEPIDKSLKTRSFSLTNNPFLSPKAMRHISTHRLSRGISDPVSRRKSSLPTILSSFEPSIDFLSLPPIPEATTPASPSANNSNPFVAGSHK